MDGGTTALRDLESSTLLSSFTEWQDDMFWARTAAFSEDASLVAMAGRAGRVEVRDVLTSQLVGSVNEGPDGHRGYLHTMAFSPNNLMFATASHDETVKLWTLDARGWAKCVENNRKRRLGRNKRRGRRRVPGHRDWAKPKENR